MQENLQQEYFCEQFGDVKLRTGYDQHEHIISVRDVEVRLKVLGRGKSAVEIYAPLKNVSFRAEYRDVMNVYIDHVQNLDHLLYYRNEDHYDIDLGGGVMLIFNGRDNRYPYSVVLDESEIVKIGDWNGVPYVKILAGGHKMRWGYDKKTDDVVWSYLRV